MENNYIVTLQIKKVNERMSSQQSTVLAVTDNRDTAYSVVLNYFKEQSEEFPGCAMHGPSTIDGRISFEIIFPDKDEKHLLTVHSGI